MLLVLADDFSGAAEIAGIGHRYGLHTEIQLSLNTDSNTDLIVLDTDTRSLQVTESIRKISELAAAIKKSTQSIRLFKKIDSVMRGHIIPELNALQECLCFNRVLLMPANPGRGRKIIGGKYFVQGVPLNETSFASDPDFPATSSHIATLVGSHVSMIKHIHVTTSEVLPTSAIITGDVESKMDLKNYVAATGEHDLCCGAAELFEVYLENLGYHPQSEKSHALKSLEPELNLVINGSTVKIQDEKEWYDRMNIAQLALPGIFKDGEFYLSPEEAFQWNQQVVETLRTKKVVVITIDHPIQHNKILSGKFLNYFVGLMTYINRQMILDNIHLCLTGGATASALIRRLEIEKLHVKGEIVPGVVSLVTWSTNGKQVFFTVKPGSYPWPLELMQKFFF